MADGQFHDRVVLITGGSSGIGRATALAFAREGARVVIASRGQERGEATRRELEDLGGEALFVPTNVSQPGQVEALLRRTVERFGRLDCAFNNAATLEVGVFKATAEFCAEEFDQHMSST
jgi:NAD(P)-dependent dehydrogenase (short-subunit alcohol dehydrogenase family)